VLSVEDYRAKVIADLNKMKTFQAAWQIWEPQINAFTEDMGNAQKIYQLGSKLSELFASTGTAGRGQGTLSSAGAAWEALVCWYLNVVFSGTRGVAVKQKKALIPACISDAATINYGTDQTNTESDLVVIVFPEAFEFPVKGGISALSEKISSKLHLFELGIIQCKTNWNDNAQIPMLWDMVYRAKGFKDHSVSIGRNSHSIQDMKAFSYSFVTVPTQKDPYKSTDMAIKRVRNLSGGNYWGNPTTSGVSLSVSEIFSKNFKAAFDKPIVQSIQDAIMVGQGRLRLS
jgi:hypothetical protein